jgi:hypothetical protein
MNYEADIKIDETALDLEWMEQPSLMIKYTRYSAEMRKVADEIEAELDVTKAEVEKEVRENPDKFGISKVTEAAVKAAILLDSRYIKVNKDLIKAKFEAKVAEGAVKAFDHRKDALENLARLLGLQYFAGPRTPRDIHNEAEKRREKINKGIASTFQRNKH